MKAKHWAFLVLAIAVVVLFLYFAWQNINTYKKPVSSPISIEKIVQELKSYDIKIQDIGFFPSSLTIKKGEEVIWRNDGYVYHTVTSLSGNELGSGRINTNEIYSHIFEKNGTFEYKCSNLPYLRGEIIVEE